MDETIDPGLLGDEFWEEMQAKNQAIHRGLADVRLQFGETSWTVRFLDIAELMVPGRFIWGPLGYEGRFAGDAIQNHLVRFAHRQSGDHTYRGKLQSLLDENIFEAMKFSQAAVSYGTSDGHLDTFVQLFISISGGIALLSALALASRSKRLSSFREGLRRRPAMLGVTRSGWIAEIGPTKVAASFVALIVVFGAAWMLRYDAKDSDFGTSIVTDRWTGKVYKCGVFGKNAVGEYERQCEPYF